jgi:hypothetical protein
MLYKCVSWENIVYKAVKYIKWILYMKQDNLLYEYCAFRVGYINITPLGQEIWITFNMILWIFNILRLQGRLYVWILRLWGELYEYYAFRVKYMNIMPSSRLYEYYVFETGYIKIVSSRQIIWLLCLHGGYMNVIPSS